MSLPIAVPARARVPWRRITSVALLTVLLTSSGVVAPDPAHADRNPDAEAWFTAAIDRERTSHGLHGLRTARDMADVAAAWSSRMAARQRIGHNPSFADQICCWTAVYENVAAVEGIDARGGLGAALQDAHRLLMSSSGHRANILHPDVDDVGVGVHVADDTLWVTQNFRIRQGATAPPPPPPPPTSEGTVGGAPGDGSAGATRTSRLRFDPREVQLRLAELGWYAADVDGLLGPRTREAITGFRKAAGLGAGERIDAQTLTALAADDPPRCWGAGRWADRSAAFAALRQRTLEIRALDATVDGAAGDEHPVLDVLDRVVSTQSE